MEDTLIVRANLIRLETEDYTIFHNGRLWHGIVAYIMAAILHNLFKNLFHLSHIFRLEQKFIGYTHLILYVKGHIALQRKVMGTISIKIGGDEEGDVLVAYITGSNEDTQIIQREEKIQILQIKPQRELLLLIQWRKMQRNKLVDIILLPFPPLPA